MNLLDLESDQLEKFRLESSYNEFAKALIGTVELYQEELRDQFAMSALSGWLASFGPEQSVEDVDMLAGFVYKIADSMLKAREVKE